MKYFIQKALTDWAYKVNDGCPDPQNRTHIQILETVLRQYGCTEEFISEYLPRVQKINEDDIVKNKDTGNVYTVKNHNPETQSLVKKDASPDDIKKVKKDVDSDVAETSPDIEKGFKKLPKRLDKLKADNVLGDADIAQLAGLEKDFTEFSKNPTKEVADAMIEKYKLSVSSNGKKLYVGVIAGDGRKALGEGSKLPMAMIDAIQQVTDVKGKGDVQKIAKNALQGASKPDLATKATAAEDEGVRELFSREPYNRLSSGFHQIFGPKGEDGKILRPSNKHSKAYFQQSVNENPSLDKTIAVLKEQEEQGTAHPNVRKSMEEHKARMQKISEDFDSMSPEDRRKAVEDSYSSMARMMHEADPDSARAIMKNVAEMALYDSEVAGGDECYLPSHGSYPSGDKLRVDRDGKGKVEKVAAVSVKFGKASNGSYGFPGETSQYIKYHPDESKRDLLKNRVGVEGYSLGVKDSVIQDKDQFDKLVLESGMGDAIKDSEAVRNKLSEIQGKIDEARSKLGDGKITKKQLVGIKEELKAINEEAKDILNENIDTEKLSEIIGAHNVKTFMKGGSHAIGIITFGASLQTSNGLSVIEHNHQVIDENGLKSETDQGSPNLRKWNLTDRMYDGRGGGIIAGYTGVEK